MFGAPGKEMDLAEALRALRKALGL